MKKQILIKSKNKDYSILVQNNSIIKNIKLESKKRKKVFVLIDSKVNRILKNIKFNNNVNLIKINASEKIKSIDYFWKLSVLLLKLKVDRSSILIVVGGGTLGDLGGFISSTILRGIELILMPTTLLSQVDSSIGGKNGINTKYGKNLIGTFYQPKKIIIDPIILKYLSKREIRSGYAEILKHSLINDKRFYYWLDKNYKQILELKPKFIHEAIIKSILIKLKYVESDEREKLNNNKSRSILNFGHTFGHALETLNNYEKKLTHGEAISIGIAVASKISLKLKKINLKDYENIIDHIKKVNLPFFDIRIQNNRIFELIKSDKKNTGSLINMVLLKKIGQAYIEQNLQIKKIKDSLS